MSRPKVLVVDDSVPVARRVSDLIAESMDAEVLDPVGTGPDALRVVTEQTPDGIVLDLNLPGMSGLEVLRAIRRQRVSCFVVVLTSAAEPEVAASSLAAGADAFLSKAADMDRLVPTMLAGLSSRAAAESPTALSGSSRLEGGGFDD